MTAREKLEAIERREELFARSGWRCVVCGRPLREGYPMLAHRIPNTMGNLKLYGVEVIHHSLNLAPTCSLRCNDAVLIGNNPVAKEELLDRIYAEIDKEKEA